MPGFAVLTAGVEPLFFLRSLHIKREKMEKVFASVVAFGLLLDIIGVIMLAELTIPKKLLKLREEIQPPNDKRNDKGSDPIRQLKLWDWSMMLILVGFALQIVGTLFGVFS